MVPGAGLEVFPTTVALAEGKTFAQFQKELTPLLQKKGWWGKQSMIDPETGDPVEVQLGSPRRLKTIYDVNLRTARAAGQWQRVQRVKAARPYLMYVIGPSKEHRDEHLKWHGTVLPVDDPWWDTHYPINGYGCKCGVRSLTAGQMAKLKQSGIPDPTAPAIRDAKGNLTGRREQRTVPVSTERPPLNSQPWLNKRTGKTEQVPEGITPGFDSNPGQVGRQVHSARVFGTKLEAATPEIGAQAMASASEFVKSGLADDYRQWIMPLARRQKHADGETRILGALKPAIIERLKSEGLTVATAAITLQDKAVHHLVRPKKREREQVLPMTEILRLVEAVSEPKAILRDTRDGNLIYVFPLQSKQFGKIVVRPAFHHKAHLDGQREYIKTHAVRTATRVTYNDLSGDQFEILDGEL